MELSECAPLVKAMVFKVVTNGSKLGIYNWIMRNLAVADKMGFETLDPRVDDFYTVLSSFNSPRHNREKVCLPPGQRQQRQYFPVRPDQYLFEETQNELTSFGYYMDKK